MSSSFLEKVYNYIKDNSSSTTTTTRTETTTSTSKSNSTGTTFSKTVSEATIVSFMTLTDGQINTFEGRISATYYSNLDEIDINVEMYMKIVACGDYIINPVFYTTEAVQGISSAIYKFRRVIHTDGDVLLTVEPLNNSNIALQSFTIEGTTNSPTDYDSLSSSDYTGSSVESSYYSSINYQTFSDTDKDSTTFRYICIDVSVEDINSV